MNTTKRRFSIIMTVYDQAHELEENLPDFLQQDYDIDYEVIVVDETSTDNTSDILKLCKDKYKNLYSTFLPKPNKYLCRRKLAFSIGIKAAKYEWIIFTTINKKPAANDILKAVNEAMDDQAEITLGYITKKGLRLQPFTHLQEAGLRLLRLERKLSKVRERKRMNYTWGRYDFIIVRKDLAFDMLKYFEQNTSSISLLGIRLNILWGNMVRRSSTTLLTTE